MFIINSIWEYFINFMEQVLFIIFIHTKLHKKANFKNQSFLMLLFLTIQFIVLCFMNQEEISSYITFEMSSINCKFFFKIFSAYFTTNMHFHIHHICFCPTTPNPPVTAGFFL